MTWNMTCDTRCPYLASMKVEGGNSAKGWKSLNAKKKCPALKKKTTLPENNSEFAPESRQRVPKGNFIFQASIFRGKLAVSFREGMFFSKIFAMIYTDCIVFQSCRT